MELRRIISFGKGSFVVSMPKTWLYRNNLKKGDLLAIDENNHQLILQPDLRDTKKEERKITIEAESKVLDIIRAEITSAYLNGYDVIEIISKDLKEKAPEIKNMIMDLAGLEIMEQTSTRLLAKYLIDIKEVSLDSLIRRIDVIIRAMMEDVLKCINRECHYDSLHQRDFDVNRLHFLAMRVIRNAVKNPNIARQLNSSPLQLKNEDLMVMNLERIGDHQKRIARYLRETKLKTQSLKELEGVYNSVRESYFDVMKAYYTKNKQLAYDVELTNKARIEKCDEFLKKNHDVVNAKLVENLKAMATFTKYIARVVLSEE